MSWNPENSTFPRFVAQAALLCAALLAPALAQTSTLQKLSFDRLVEEADVIVQGRVETLKARGAPDRGSLSTRVTVSVAQQFKGAKLSSVTIEQPGGSMGDVVQASPGLPEFSPGEEVIVFLKRRRDQTYSVVGGRQGKFTARTPPGSDGEIVEDFARRTEKLDDFLERLAKALKQ